MDHIVTCFRTCTAINPFKSHKVMAGMRAEEYSKHCCLLFTACVPQDHIFAAYPGQLCIMQST